MIPNSNTNHYLYPPGSREKILCRIREALRIPAPKRHLKDHCNLDSPQFKYPQQNLEHPYKEDSESSEKKNTKENLHPHLSNHRLWLPPVPQDTPGKISLFASLSQTLRTNFQLCPTYSLAKSKLQQLASEENWKTIYTHSEEWKNTLSTILPTTNVLSTHPHYDKHALAAADASITNCECLIAQTGSVLISSTYCGGRNLSVLPPHHVVLAEVSQLVGDLTDAFLFLQQKYGSNLPPYISIITGPSRTGDIERILVLGAHGPKKLSIILIEENPPP